MSEFSKKTVLIVNHYPYNKGDHAVLRVLINKILECWPNTMILVSSYDVDFTKKMNKEIIAIPWPLDIKRVAEATGYHRYIYGLKELLKGFMWINKKHIDGTTKFIKSVKKSDLVISPGGHLFTTMNNILSILSYSSSIVAAKNEGKKVLILSQTIGPFKGVFSLLAKWATKRALQNADIITLREKSSLVYMRKFNILNYQSAGELVFLLEPRYVNIPQLNKRQENKLKIGITIHHSYFRYWFSKEEYIKAMSAVALKIIKELSAEIYFIPMEYNIYNKSEYDIIKKIKVELNKKGVDKYINILPLRLSPEETLYVISKMDLMIPTKMHSIILSLTSKTPLLAIAYHEKTFNFMKSFDLEDYVIHIKDIQNIDVVVNKVKKVYENRETIVKKINEHLPAQKEEALKNIYIMKDVLGECYGKR